MSDVNNDGNNRYTIVSQNDESTVVADYQKIVDKIKETSYQTEADLEKEFIEQLQKQAYEYIKIKTEADLIANLRKQLEKINKIQFTENEWLYFYRHQIANPNHGIIEKTQTIQEDFIKNLSRDDGTTKNIYLLNKESIHDNTLQVINQYEVSSGMRANRYDVTILINGLPLVHLELKKRGVAIREAFNQINRYQRESFWAESALYEYIQIFVITNGTHTKYYSNTTRLQHIKDADKKTSQKRSKTSHSYEFTSWWADANNKPIADLKYFTRTFFAKHTILNILCKYCIFTTDKLLLVMRPYQIAATERILNRIEISTNYKKLGSIEAGGYIWHTTGSGKTLTSFKTAQLASKLGYIEKVLFVVDRKDLDYQTMKEYDKFEKGAANSNSSTRILKKQLEDINSRIIITTIQKLDRFISLNSGHEIYSKHIVIIFDECHRSQFGNMHLAITKAFKKYHIFGFTGTPIFANNSSSRGRADLKTTEQTFGDKLHTYTIVDAINDKNVLPFKVEYFSTFKTEEDIEDKKVQDIDREKALQSPTRIENIVRYIREHFNQKTLRNTKSYQFNSLTNIPSVAKAKDRNKIEEIKQTITLSGFNSLFAVSSIDVAKLYYAEFKKQQKEENNPLKKLKVALIYSFGVNDDDLDGLLDENSENTRGLTSTDRDFLEDAMSDYNEMFGTSYDTSADKFQNYYKDVSLRVKQREIDLLIVVNMFLTGFDATTLNTLWVDKNLRLHGLLQAFSRTNRILNSVKRYGNIVCFRNLEKATNESIALFGNKEASGVVLLKPFSAYYNGTTTNEDGSNEENIRGYVSLVAELQEKFPAGEMLVGEENERAFIKLFGELLKARNILSSFDEFVGKEILTERDLQDYHSSYIDLYDKHKKERKVEGKEDINDDLIFEIELIKQVEINIDYILELIKKYNVANKEKRDEVLSDITKAINSSIDLRNKKELIHQFISRLNVKAGGVEDAWHKFVETKKLEELETIIKENNLNKDETYKFVQNAFRDGSIPTSGTGVSNILPPISRFSPEGERSKKRETVMTKLLNFFDKFFDITGSSFEG